MNTAGAKKAQRNYQLDFYKLMFSVIVLISHCGVNFANERTRIPFAITWNSLGHVSVHAFFVISGLLMINSLYKKNFEPGEISTKAFNFMIDKYKSIFSVYFISLLIHVIVHFIVYGSEKSVPELPFLVHEIFLLLETGTDISMVQPHTWYISAMLLALLPLSYIFMKNKDFYINVFAPLVAVLSMGFMYSGDFTGKTHLLGNKTWCLFIMGGVIRAICGICWGAVAWLIYKQLSEKVEKKKHRIFVTIAEVVVFAIFVAIWLHAGLRTEYNYIVKMLLPVLIGIVFSGKSYISEIFKHKIFSKCGSLSLTIYLTHWTAEKIVWKFNKGAGFVESLLWMVPITLATCLLVYGIEYLVKLLWNKKLKQLIS